MSVSQFNTQEAHRDVSGKLRGGRLPTSLTRRRKSSSAAATRSASCAGVRAGLGLAARLALFDLGGQFPAEEEPGLGWSRPPVGSAEVAEGELALVLLGAGDLSRRPAPIREAIEALGRKAVVKLTRLSAGATVARRLCRGDGSRFSRRPARASVSPSSRRWPSKSRSRWPNTTALPEIGGEPPAGTSTPTDEEAITATLSERSSTMHDERARKVDRSAGVWPRTSDGKRRMTGWFRTHCERRPDRLRTRPQSSAACRVRSLRDTSKSHRPTVGQ